MATAKGAKHSKGFYRDLNEQSSSIYFKTSKRCSGGKLYEIERIVSSKTVKGKALYLCRWKNYGPLTDTWEPEENLNTQALRSFREPRVTQEEVRKGTEALGLGLLQHLRSKHGNSDSFTTVEMREDVFRYLFKNKGKQSQRRGWFEYERGDFVRCGLPASWDAYIDHLGDGKRITFPVLAKPVLNWGPKSYEKSQSGNFNLVPRYYRETVRLCFSTRAYTVN